MSTQAHKITFCVDVFNGPGGRELGEALLTDLLEVMVKHNVRWLGQHPQTPRLYASGVRYQTEPAGREEWQDIATNFKRRVGDCEDLSCALAAEKRFFDGVPARAFLTLKQLPHLDLYHIRVVDPAGHIEDPSARLGMRT